MAHPGTTPGHGWARGFWFSLLISVLPSPANQDPVAWLDQFFAACGNVDEGDYCGITHLAVHSYTCEVWRMEVE